VELIPLVEDFKSRTKTNSIEFRVALDTLREVAGTSVAAPQQKSPRKNWLVVWPEEHPLEVDFVEWKSKGDSDIHPQEIILRDGEIWCWAFHAEKGSYSSGFDAARSFIKANPATGHCVEIPFPPELDPARYQRAGFSFEVMDGALFASAPNRLMRFRLRENKWEEISVPVEGQARLIGLNGRLYVATEASLLELEPNSNSVKVLVSSRRRPVENELDSVWNDSVRLFIRSDGQLGVQATNRLFSFDPGSRKWSGKVELPESLSNKWVEQFSGEGVYLLPNHPWLHRNLITFWNDQERPELLLEQSNPRAAKSAPAGQSYGPPRWKWPEPFRLDVPYFFPDGKSLWMLHPRIMPWGGGGYPDSEPITFQDRRHATLLSFAPGRPDCLQVPLVLRKDGRPINLFTQEHIQWSGNSFFRAPVCLATGAGFVIVDSDFGGDWFISKATLQASLKPLPAPVASVGGQTNSTGTLKP